MNSIFLFFETILLRRFINKCISVCNTELLFKGKENGVSSSGVSIVVANNITIR